MKRNDAILGAAALGASLAAWPAWSNAPALPGYQVIAQSANCVGCVDSIVLAPEPQAEARVSGAGNLQAQAIFKYFFEVSAPADETVSVNIFAALSASETLYNASSANVLAELTVGEESPTPAILRTDAVSCDVSGACQTVFNGAALAATPATDNFTISVLTNQLYYLLISTQAQIATHSSNQISSGDAVVDPTISIDPGSRAQFPGLGLELSPFVGNSSAGGVPEPATWGFMILGFALLGVALRRRAITL